MIVSDLSFKKEKKLGVIALGARLSSPEVGLREFAFFIIAKYLF
jgi:hypothetical protein